MIKKAELQQDFNILMLAVEDWRLGLPASVDELLVLHEGLKKKHK